MSMDFGNTSVNIKNLLNSIVTFSLKKTFKKENDFEK